MKNQSNMKPMPFSTPMVQAILDGRKTQTRRLAKGIALESLGPDMFTPEYVAENFAPHQLGDILYVKEEHLVTRGAFNDWVVEYKDGTMLVFEEANLPADTIKRLTARKTLGKWQRGRFLPKALARIHLQVTAVKAEKLNDITEADAIAEGILSFRPFPGDGAPLTSYMNYWFKKFDCFNPVSSFLTLWCSINGPESWNQNPWVFAYTFERCDAPNPKS